jgi:recombination protein RecA
MANIARAALETALRDRKLDRTLTTALPTLERDEAAVVPVNVAAIDRCLQGGVPRGHLSEIAGPSSSGRTTLLLHLMAAATARGEIVAFVDTLDRLDVASAAAAGIDLDRLLWIRGESASHASGPERVERALKALNLVLQAGGFGVVAIDLADVAASTLKQIPFTTWMRVQRVIEGSDTACLIVASEPLSRSSGGLTMALAGRTTWAGVSTRSRRLAGIDVRMRVMSPRRRVDGEANVQALANEITPGLQDRPGLHRSSRSDSDSVGRACSSGPA